MDRLRLLLRSVYLKGHQDGNNKTTDLSWEDGIVEEITKLKEGLSFVEIKRNKFGRRWAIKSYGRIISMGYNYEFMKKLFEQQTS